MEVARRCPFCGSTEHTEEVCTNKLTVNIKKGKSAALPKPPNSGIAPEGMEITFPVNKAYLDTEGRMEHTEQYYKDCIRTILITLNTEDLFFLMDTLDGGNVDSMREEGDKILIERGSSDFHNAANVVIKGSSAERILAEGTRVRIKDSQGRYSGRTGKIVEKLNVDYAIKIDDSSAAPIAYTQDQFIILKTFKEEDLVLAFSQGSWRDGKYVSVGEKSGEHIVMIDGFQRRIIKDELDHWS